MFNLNFNISNPFSTRWNTVYSRHWCITKNKTLEIELLQDASVISFSIRLGFRQDHAGFHIAAGLLGYDFNINFYDNRHWDLVTQTWEI